MKSLVYAVAAAAALTASFGAFAQSSQPLTRADVRAQLVELEQVGYQPGVASPYYPQDIQAAQARLAVQDSSGIGSQPAAVVEAGRPAPAAQLPSQSVYFGR